MLYVRVRVRVMVRRIRVRRVRVRRVRVSIALPCQSLLIANRAQNPSSIREKSYQTLT